MASANFSQKYTQNITQISPGDISHYDFREKTNKEGFKRMNQTLVMEL